MTKRKFFLFTKYVYMCILDISNKGRIGASEVELVQRMIDGVDKLIAMEEQL
jgi:protein-arginine kinase